ncbi:fibronectin type III domain-containing protein [Sphingobacterium sp. LRF_L2]|uniref:fibronectin type III domain-containing protein n=1 Tax=Sphingobacterium sp. LRF_L2 TaxID=3369421 RepID=UPI003F616188
MRKEKVVTNYGKLNHDELAVLAGKIVTAMTDNANFTTPNPTVAELTALTEDYRLKQETSIRGGSVLDKRLKRESRDNLLNGLTVLAHYVNTTANGNLAALTSSALILAKQPGSKNEPIVVARIMLKDGPLSGQMRVDFTSQKDIWDYEYELGQVLDDSGIVTWEDSFLTTSSRGNIVSSLVPARRYHVRVRARNSKGTGDWSESASMIVR